MDQNNNLIEFFYRYATFNVSEFYNNNQENPLNTNVYYSLFETEAYAIKFLKVFKHRVVSIDFNGPFFIRMEKQHTLSSSEHFVTIICRDNR